MAVVASVIEVFSTLQTVCDTYKDVQDRFEKASENPTLANELGQALRGLLNNVAPLARTCRINDVQFSDDFLNIFQRHIQKLDDFVKNTHKELEQRKKKLDSWLHRFRTAKTTSEWLSDLKVRVEEAERDVVKIASCFAPAEVTAKTYAAVVDLKEDVAALTISNQKQDSFQPSFDVPQNPPHVVLQFGSESDMEGDAVGHLTVEAQLKDSVLRSDGLRSVAAVGSSSTLVPSVGMRGMSGVGKSCALQGLATDLQVRQRFPDGIYFLVLG